MRTRDVLGHGVQRRPGAERRWLGVAPSLLAAAVVFGCGLAVSGILVFQAVSSVLGQYPGSDTPRVLAPGSTDLQFAEPGTYVVYYEYHST